MDPDALSIDIGGCRSSQRSQVAVLGQCRPHRRAEGLVTRIRHVGGKVGEEDWKGRLVAINYRKGDIGDIT